MDQAASDRLKMYIKWGGFTGLDYDSSSGVDDPDYLVQISRDGLQEQIENDITVFTEEDLERIKATDAFILDNIENSSKWLSPDESKTKSLWWWHLDKIAAGEMEKPDIEAFHEP